MKSNQLGNFSTEFFKEGIISYTKKQFEEFSQRLEVIYSENFEHQFIHPVYFEKIETIKSIIETNHLSKLWLTYATNLQIEADKLNYLFEKEINTKNAGSNGSGYKDKDLGNINLRKARLVSLILIVCIKTNINRDDDMRLFKEKKQTVIELFEWLGSFARFKELNNECEKFIQEIILKLPILVTTKHTMMNPLQLRWFEELFVLMNIDKEYYEKEIKNIRETQEMNTNAFTKLRQPSKEGNNNIRHPRSRMNSFDKNDMTIAGNNNKDKEKNEDKNKDSKIYNYFKPIMKIKPDKKKEDNKTDYNNNITNDMSNGANKSELTPTLTLSQKDAYNSFSFNNNYAMPYQSQPSITFGDNMSYNNDLNQNDDTYSMYSESNYSKRDFNINHYHFKTSTYSNLKLFKNYSNVSSSALSINSFNAYSNPIPGLDRDSQQYSHKSSGINSLLKSKMKHYSHIPTIHNSRHHLSRSREKESSFQKKLKNRIINDENYNSRNDPIVTLPKKDPKFANFKDLIRKNFYKTEEENKTEPPSPIYEQEREKTPETMLRSTVTKTKQTTLSKGKAKNGDDDEVLVYRTPNKISFISNNNAVSPCTTRKNLLALFQQVNK